MFCPNCGKEVENTWSACPYCGQILKREGDDSKEIPKQKNISYQTSVPNKSVDSNKKHSLLKKILIAMGILIGIFIIIAVLVPEEKVEEVTEEFKSEDHDTAVDLSNMDLETLVGASAEEVKALGIPYDEETGVAESGAVLVTFNEDKNVDMISIEKSEEADSKAPSFHGVTLDMGKEEASSKLADTYTVLEDDGDLGFVRVNKDTKVAVTCGCENGKVSKIIYMVCSDEFLADIIDLEAPTEYEVGDPSEYIFPESDSKYLSEDEICSVEADKLRIGRNEIFARHGGIFESEDLKKHFKKCSWYEGTIPVGEINPETDFNDFEKKNVELIKKVEDEINGADSNAKAASSVIEQCLNNLYWGEVSELTISFNELRGDQINVQVAGVDTYTGTITGDNIIEFISAGNIQTIHFSSKDSFEISGDPGDVDFSGRYYNDFTDEGED